MTDKFLYVEEGLRRKVARADFYASKYLGDFNELDEKRLGQTPKALKLYEKAQYWLDRLNHLLGND